MSNKQDEDEIEDDTEEIADLIVEEELMDAENVEELCTSSEWSYKSVPLSEFPLFTNSFGPINADYRNLSPLALFNKFFTPFLMNWIVIQTNVHANQVQTLLILLNIT